MSPSSSSKGKSSSLSQHYEEKVRPCIDLVDSLRSLGVEEDLNLPAIAVIGDQSSGKSSVLEALSGVALPRGTGIVTRCPLVLKLKRITKDNNWHGLLSYNGQIKQLKNPAEIENAVLNAQTVLAGEGEGISHEMITLEIQSSDVPDLTLIDLPGIARIATGNQPKDIEKQIKDLIEKFIKRQKTISLVVVPANIDIATTEALQMASKVDSTGQRTLGILTKPDLVDKGMEETVVRTVNNQVIPLKKGYMIVKCRGQQDINEKLGLVKALEKERRFFYEHAHFRSVLEEGKATVPLLAERLTKELVEHIYKTLPQLQKQLERKLEKTNEDLRALGDGVPTDEHEKSNFLITKIRQFNDALEGVKRAEEDLKNSDSDIRVFTKIREEFGKWKVVLNAKTIKTEETVRNEVEAYIRTCRGKELPGFLNYRTFENIVKKHIEELEEPALKLLKDVADIVHSCVDHIVNSHFNAFSHLLRAAKDPIEDFFDEQFQKAVEKIHYQFKIEKIVYCQDSLYSDQLSIVKQKPINSSWLRDADLREMVYHLSSYFKITSERLANQVPLIVQYHILDQYISHLQNAMLAIIGRNNPGMLIQEDSAIARKRKHLKDRLERLKSAGKILSKFVHST
ncbi:unnamed protein product [Leuciscus chuanchicus]